ncbi:MAG TPA: hypothetical protein VGB84_01935 [Arachidicoccus sp.]
MKSTIILFAFFLLSSVPSLAQDPASVSNSPVIVEPMIGSKGLYIQSFFNKKFNSIPSLGILSLSGLSTEWKKKSEIKEVMMQSYFNYSLYRGFSINAGFIYNNVEGIRPTAGGMYFFANENCSVIVFPRIDLIKNPNLETFAMAEYKPEIKSGLRFYSRLQCTYIHHLTENHHQRSYLYARAGIAVKEFIFGAAFNMDYFGPDKTNTNNVGLFLNVQLY